MGHQSGVTIKDYKRQIADIEELLSLRNNFFEFFKQAWKVFEPSTPLALNWHHQVIAEHLQGLYENKIHRLLIALPPRFSKSSMVSVAFPAWVWVTKPSTRFLCASYALSLSLRDSQRCRELIDSPWYQARFSDSFEWTGDQNVKCLRGDTKIQTDQGELAIQAIVDGQLPVKVVSYNHNSGMQEYKSILAYEKHPGRQSLQVTCSNGSSMVCTTNHPFYVLGRGYVQADKLQVGDTVYASSMCMVREDVQLFRLESQACRESLLQQSMLQRVESNEAHNSAMRSVREFSKKGSKPQRSALFLQFGMRKHIQNGRKSPTIHSSLASSVRKLWQTLREKTLSGQGQQVLFLFSGVHMGMAEEERPWYAEENRVGNVGMRSVRQGVREKENATHKKLGALLQQRMSENMDNDQGDRVGVQVLWESDTASEKNGGWACKNVLQQAVPNSMEQRELCKQKDRKDVRGVRQIFHGVSSLGAFKVLLTRMLLGSTSLEDPWTRTSSVRQRVWNDVEGSAEARQQSMYALPQCTGATGSASYRPQQDEQCGKQSDNIMPGVPCARDKGHEKLGVMAKATIQNIISVVSPSYVYNIEIADNHNYFSNNILTHNSRYTTSYQGSRISTSVDSSATGEGGDYVLCDDPHNIQEGESDLIRQQTLFWWDRVMTSRLNDQATGKMVVIGQRVNEDDLIGHLLETGDWEYLALPAEYEESRKFTTSLGWEDPRTKDGEPLWQEKFPKSVLAYLKKTLGIHYYSQYQQSPVRDSGNIFKSTYFLNYSEYESYYVLYTPDGEKQVAKSACRTVISTDLALSEKAEADYTVFLTWAVTPHMEFLLTDIVHERMESPVGEEILWGKAVSARRFWAALIENTAYQKSVIQRLRRGTPVQTGTMRKGIPVIEFRPTTDKVARAQSIVVWFSSGNFYFNSNVAGYADFKKELLGFPRAGHDDFVDACSIIDALFQWGEPRLTDYSEIEQLTLEEESIQEISKSNSELAQFLAEDDGIEYHPWWETV